MTNQNQQLQRALAAERLMSEYCKLQILPLEISRDRYEEIFDKFARYKLLNATSIRLLRQHAFAKPPVLDRQAKLMFPLQFHHKKGDPYESFLENFDGLIDNGLRLFHRYEGLLKMGANPAIKPEYDILIQWDCDPGAATSDVDYSSVNIEWDRLADYAVPMSSLSRQEKDLQRTLAALLLFQTYCQLQQGKLPVASREHYDSLLEAFRDYHLLTEKSIGILDQLSRRSVDSKGPRTFMPFTFVHKYGQPYSTVLDQLNQCIEMLATVPKPTPTAGPFVPMGMYGDFDRGKPMSVRPRDYSQVNIQWEKLV